MLDAETESLGNLHLSSARDILESFVQSGLSGMHEAELSGDGLLKSQHEKFSDLACKLKGLVRADAFLPINVSGLVRDMMEQLLEDNPSWDADTNYSPLAVGNIVSLVNGYAGCAG